MVMVEATQVEYIGFSGPEAAHVIIWKLLDKKIAKTMCYTAEEVEEQLKLHAWKFDGYEVLSNADENL
ncbi:TPA: hypothetical protein ACGY1T_000783 [Listeria monocytogenes]|uniref:hypothetical protein n=1 Tax=Listeria TaxID=1637 RepID=UPI000A6AB335|nr:hypothetical protein [Listeria monocytogenes]